MLTGKKPVSGRVQVITVTTACMHLTSDYHLHHMQACNHLPEDEPHGCSHSAYGIKTSNDKPGGLAAHSPS